MKQYPIDADIGRINDMSKVDYLVLGMSKCGTTTIYEALNNIGICVRFHSDYTLKRVYKTTELSAKSLVAQTSNLIILTPYRNLIARKISQYYQYELKGSIKDFCLGDYSQISDGFRTEIDEDMVFANVQDVTGINILDYRFNKRRGYSIILKNGVALIPYVLEKIDNLGKLLGASMRPKRVSNREFMDLEFSDAELDEIYNSVYCQYFYTAKQIEEFKLWAKG